MYRVEYTPLEPTWFDRLIGAVFWYPYDGRTYKQYDLATEALDQIHNTQYPRTSGRDWEEVYNDLHS